MKSLRNLLLTALLLLLSVTVSLFLNACGGNPLQDAVDEINSNEAMHADMDGFYKVHAEAQGESTIVVKFQAEHEELATPEVSQVVSDEAASGFHSAVQEMRKAGISDPTVVLEFLDMNGNQIYTRRFS